MSYQNQSRMSNGLDQSRRNHPKAGLRLDPVATPRIHTQHPTLPTLPTAKTHGRRGTRTDMRGVTSLTNSEVHLCNDHRT